jgi:hypothetical protein
MPKFRNVSGHDLEIVTVGRVVADDEVFEVPDEWFDGFACQPSNYAVVEDRPVKEK